MWNTNIFMVLMLFASVHTLTDEEAKKKFVNNVLRCSKTHAVDMKDLVDLEKRIVPQKTETKCLLACAYRMDGTMGANGQFESIMGHKFADDQKNGDDARATRVKKLADLCSKTNEIKVSDGEKGCERAAHIFKCITENAPKLGFKS